jgi:hypothetical protein
MNYNESKSADASRWREVLENAIQKRIGSAVNVIETVKSQIIEDHIVRAKSLNFSAVVDNQSDTLATVVMQLPNKTEKCLHQNAVRQLAEKSNMPKKFIDMMIGEGHWGASLIAHNFNEILHHGNGEKNLIRSIGNETRAFLSDRFRRIDSRPLVDAFAGTAQEFGLMPYEGYALDTTVRIRGIIPVIFEPYPGEFVAFGLQWKNSDFGVGGHELGFFMLRPTCLNGAVGDSVLRQVHLGGRLSEDLIYSQETYQLDTMANVSALKDVVRAALNPANIDQHVEAIKIAQAKNITPKEAKEMLKARLSKADTDEVIEAYNSPDIEMMPAGNTAYRLSNALSWVANLKRDSQVEKSLELQQIAGEIMPKVKLLNA